MKTLANNGNLRAENHFPERHTLLCARHF